MFDSMQKINELLSKVKTETNARKLIDGFYTEYFKQVKDIQEKLKICHNPDNRKRIIDFKEDLDNIKDKFDIIISDLEIGKIKKIKTIIVISKDILALAKKYDKENTDIVNFKV